MEIVEVLEVLEVSELTNVSDPIGANPCFSVALTSYNAITARARRRRELKVNKQRRREKVHTVMSEFKRGKLHSGSKKGPEVKNRKQAVAIALSEARKAG
jgi:hypothetical protein